MGAASSVREVGLLRLITPRAFPGRIPIASSWARCSVPRCEQSWAREIAHGESDTH
jgi:hypothetical protein